MNERFVHFVESLEPSFKRLMAMPPVKASNLPSPMPKAGVYLLTERGRHLYVGRTDRLRARLQEHCRVSSSHNSAPFAFRLAREILGVTKASYKVEGSRSHLQSQAPFASEFAKAKERLRKMDCRFVEEGDPLRQALLEIYVAVALHTPYNDFANH